MRFRPRVALCVCGLLLAFNPAKIAAQRADTRLGPAQPSASLARGAATILTADNKMATSPPSIAQPGALVPLFEQLLLLSSTHDESSLHMIHFGDSHAASDDWSVGLRHSLKERFGDGGSGFSLAGHPFPSYRRFDVLGGGTAGWHSDGLRTATGDGYFGLGGVSISTQAPGQSVFVEAECDHLEIHYLQQPGGGDLALYERDQLLKKFSTAGDLAAGFVGYQTTPGRHRFLLKTMSVRPVRLFGWVADKETGVTYEALGINGAEASVILRWNENMLADYLRRRNPGLVVLAYGTNEAKDTGWSSAKYEAMFSALLQRFRRALPDASILVLGPPDCQEISQGVWRQFKGLDGIIAAQRRACNENDCAFWDTRERMGGPNSMRDWVQNGFAQRDYVHFTPAGYRRLAAALFADMMGQYEVFKKVRDEISDPVSSGPTNSYR